MRKKEQRSKAIKPPISILCDYLDSGNRVRILLYDRKNMWIEGVIRGFDEFMNIVLLDAEEVYYKKGQRIATGTILLKGENITMVTEAVPLPTPS